MVGAADLLAGRQRQLGALAELDDAALDLVDPELRARAGRRAGRPRGRPASDASRAIATFSACSSRAPWEKLSRKHVRPGPDQLRHASRPSAWPGRSWRRSSFGGGRGAIRSAPVGSAATRQAFGPVAGPSVRGGRSSGGRRASGSGAGDSAGPRAPGCTGVARRARRPPARPPPRAGTGTTARPRAARGRRTRAPAPPRGPARRGRRGRRPCASM